MIKKQIYLQENILTVSKKQSKSLDIFWYGFLIYIIGFFLSSTEYVYSTINPAFSQGLQLVGVIVFITGAIYLLRFKFDDKYLEIVFSLYIAYSLTIIARGFSTDFGFLKKMFLDVMFGIFPYLTPLVVLFPRNIGTYKKVFSVLLILASLYFIVVVIFFKSMRTYDWLDLPSRGLVEGSFSLFALPTGFLLITYIYHVNKKNLFAALVMLIAVYFLIFKARRGSLFISLTTLASVGMIFLIYTKKKLLIIFMSVFLIIVVALFISSIKTPALFNFLLTRGDEDTRTGVEQEMYADMSLKDWVIGKGINGQYYSHSVDNVMDIEGSGQREAIETGYLQIILKGGILSLVLLLLILIPAIYKGFFKSKNILSKGAAMFILLWVIYLYPIIGVTFTMHYILVWICVGICYSKKIGKLSDAEIKAHLL